MVRRSNSTSLVKMRDLNSEDTGYNHFIMENKAISLSVSEIFMVYGGKNISGTLSG